MIVATGAAGGGLFEAVSPVLVSFVVVVAVGAALLGIDRLLQRRVRKDDSWRVRKQVTMLGLTVLGVIIVVLTLPVRETTEGQLLGLLGLAVTAALTLSSTTFVANAMAGLMLRAVENISVGSFIQVGDHFGRVTERGLFHVEIQTEDRDLCTLPNLYVVTNPVKVVSATGTIVSATVSLGYDAHHAKIETLLLAAAETAGLTDGFVQMVELGDFSVTYRAAGFLPKVKHLLTARSNLRKAMFDSLHAGGIEIVSPTYMAQRRLGEESRVAPSGPWKAGAGEATGAVAAPEDLMFEKADEAEAIESLRERRAGALDSIEEVKGRLKDAKHDEAERERLTTRLGQLERLLVAVEKRIEEREGGGDAGKN